MRITSIRQTASAVGGVASEVVTDTLIIETPDPEPVTFITTYLGEPLDGNRPTPEPRYGTSTTDSKCGRGGGNSGDQFVVMGDRAAEVTPAVAAWCEQDRRDQDRRPHRDVPLWRYARDYSLQEFPNNGPHGAAKFADQFFGGWQRYTDKLNG